MELVQFVGNIVTELIGNVIYIYLCIHLIYIYIHCLYAHRGALCEVQSLNIRAKDSYGRGVGRIRNRCADNKENDAGLCYPKCGDESVWDGVGPVMCL